jgi:competence protein ComEA
MEASGAAAAVPDEGEPTWEDDDSGWTPQRPDPTRSTAARSQGRHRPAKTPRPPLITVPDALRDLAVRPSRLAVLGLLVVVVLAGLVLGVRVAWARSGAQPHPVAAQAGKPLVQRSVPADFATSNSSDGRTPMASSTTSPTPLPTAATVLLVHVVGQVRHPGVVRLPPGSRVKDAVRAAGGATGRADLREINLARPVADGEQIVVPRPGERPTPLPGAPPDVGGAPVAGGVAADGAAGAATDGPPLDLNAATAAQLEELPGVGPVLSQRIVEWRTEHGRFSTVDELMEVSGIGEKMLAEIAPRVRV